MSKVPPCGIPMPRQRGSTRKLPSSNPNEPCRLRRGQNIRNRIELRNPPFDENEHSPSSAAWNLASRICFPIKERTRRLLLVRGVGFEPTKAYATGSLLKPDLKSSTTPHRSGPAPLT